MNPDILALILIGGSLLVSLSVVLFLYNRKWGNVPVDDVAYWNSFRAAYAETQWRYNSQWNRENNAS